MNAPRICNLNPFDTIQQKQSVGSQEIETEKCSEGGMKVANIENWDYIKVKGVDFGFGAATFEARVSSLIVADILSVTLTARLALL